MPLTDGKVLLTGATGGIGHEIARVFASRGASLVLTGRRAELLEPLGAETGARTLTCDLSSREDVERLIAEAGDVDVLVANAAVPASGELTSLGQEEIDRMLEVNLRAPIALARGIAPGMVARGRGHIVFISSLSGKVVSPYSSLYSASKFGLRGFALGARTDLRDRGVGVSTVNPGFVSDAGMFADTGVKLPPGVGMVTPRQVADAVLRAVEKDRAEIDVAPVALRVSAAFAQLAPQAAAAAARRLGSDKIATQMARSQSTKR